MLPVLPALLLPLFLLNYLFENSQAKFKTIKDDDAEYKNYCIDEFEVGEVIAQDMYQTIEILSKSIGIETGFQKVDCEAAVKRVQDELPADVVSLVRASVRTRGG